MPLFIYRAIDTEARVQTGTMQASNELELEQSLGLRGMTLVEARVSVLGFARELLQPKFSDKELQNFTYMLKILSASGLSLLSGLRGITEGHADKRLRDAVHHLCAGVESGKPLSQTMQERPEIFPGFYVQMIRAGELSGTLDKSIDALLSYLEWQTEFRKTLRSYFAYPLIIFCILILLAGALFTFVFPALLKIFTRLKVDVPLPTRILLETVGFVQEYYLVLGGGLFAGAVLLKLWSLSKEGRRALDSIVVSLPVIGDLVVKINLSRYFKALATLHGSGIDIQEAFAIAASVVSNTFFREKLTPITEAITSGQSIAAAMARTGVIESLVVEMVAMGERTGSLDSTLFRICDIYDREVPETTKKMFTVIEPLIVLIMGFMVLMVLLAIFLPIYGIVGGIKVR